MISRTGNKQRIAYSGQRREKDRLSAKGYPLSAQKGLTLIEVLLAVSILGLGIVGVLRGYASSIVTLETGQYNIDAVGLLKMKMAEVEIMVREKDGISPGSERGPFAAPYQNFLWEWDIQPTEVEDLYALSMVVSSDFNPRTFSLTTYVADKKTEEEEE